MDELAIARIRRFCHEAVPENARDELRVEFGVRGNSVTIFECRPPWAEWMGPEWTRMKVAQLRFDPSDRKWRLYWPDRNGRWHEHWDLEPSASIEPLIREIEEDSTGIFW